MRVNISKCIQLVSTFPNAFNSMDWNTKHMTLRGWYCFKNQNLRFPANYQPCKTDFPLWHLWKSKLHVTVAFEKDLTFSCNTENHSFYLLLRVLHPSHADLATSLHSHWVSVRSRWSVWLSWISSARLRVGTVAHPVHLWPLHGHRVHWCHLLRRVSTL